MSCRIDLNQPGVATIERGGPGLWVDIGRCPKSFIGLLFALALFFETIKETYGRLKEVLYNT